MSTRARCVALVATVLVLAAVQPEAASPAGGYFKGVELIDQDGQTVDLYEVMKGRTIVVNSFFTTCTSSCPVMSGTLGAVQTRFRERMGKDLVLASISVDPEHDTPATLKQYAQHVKALPGWLFLTGSREQVERALGKLGQSVVSREEHYNVMIVGNDRTGLWKKAFALAKPEDVVGIVGSVLDDSGTAGEGTPAHE
jgi:protein SCO1